MDGEIREMQSSNYDNFTSIIEYITNYKNIYEDKIGTADVSKENVKKYIETYQKCENYLLKAYKKLDLRKTKFVLNNAIVEFYYREINEPLTMETLGKYLYKYYYHNEDTNIVPETDNEKRKKI